VAGSARDTTVWADVVGLCAALAVVSLLWVVEPEEPPGAGFDSGGLANLVVDAESLDVVGVGCVTVLWVGTVSGVGEEFCVCSVRVFVVAVLVELPALVWALTVTPGATSVVWLEVGDVVPCELGVV
jgi:hypothetical protein